MLDNSSGAEAAALVAAALAVVALGIALALAVRLGRLQRSYDALVAGGEGTSFVDAVQAQSAATQALRRDVAALRDDLGSARADLSDALRHVGVVRYDAFGDMGGRLSFSAALLDDAGDGLVLTSINGRSETRTYAKGVRSGASDLTLSPEETEAIAHATRPRGDNDLTDAGSPGRSGPRSRTSRG